MGKRISLFIFGLVVAFGVFLLYLYFTDATLLGIKSPPPPHEAVAHPGLEFEERQPTGELVYLFKALKATPVKDPNTGQAVAGQYELTDPEVTYYLPDGRVARLCADSGTIAIDPAKGRKTKVFGGRLSGHVKLIFSPGDLAIDPAAPPKSGQIEVTLEKDVDISVTDSQLRSPGKVHVESRDASGEEDLVFDGGGLTVAFNRTQKRIEYLRIDPLDPLGVTPNEIVIHHVGQGNTSFLGGLGDSKKGPETAPAATEAVAATAPSKNDAYKLSFGDHVNAALTSKQGISTLSSDRLFVLFMSPNREKSKALLKPPAETQAATERTAKTAPATAPEMGDLRVTWIGPMEMRPLGPDDMALADDKDRALVAEGTATQPVVVKEGNTVIQAGLLWYHKAEDRVELEPHLFGYVNVNDPGMGKVACHGISLFQGKNKVLLAGPGTLEIPQNIMHKNKNVPADAKPLLLTWTKTIDVDWLSAGDMRNADKRSIRRALISGDVVVKAPEFEKDPAFEMGAGKLDLLMAKNAPGKTGQVLEHLLATDRVQIKRARPGFTLDNNPQGLNADRLEVMTTPDAATGIPEPSRLFATGNVVAWTFANQSEFGEEAKADAKAPDKRLVRQTIYTPTLDVLLEPRERGASGGATSGLAFGSSTAIKSLTAADGVKVELEGFETAGANQNVVATAKTMLADPRAGKATLKGDPGLNQPNAVPQPVVVTMGDNRIKGDEILLDQKARLVAGAHSIEIPGPGSFLIEPAKAPGEKGSPPMLITWTQKMTYDDQPKLARFTGGVTVDSVGQTDQTINLTCNDYLEVQLASTAAAAPGSKKPPISRLTAMGDVKLTDTQFESPDQSKMTLRMYTRTPEIIWTDADKMLDLPSHGNIQIEDYRGKPKGAEHDAQDSSGTTIFAWTGNVKFDTNLGIMTMTAAAPAADGVHVIYVPLTPIHMEKQPSAPASANAIKRLDLYGDVLTAKLAQKPQEPGKKTSSLPMALGSGGKQNIESAKMQGHARADSGDTEVTAETLDFDAVKNTVTAVGKGRVPAHVIGPEQNIDADELIWDRTKDHQDIQIVRPHGVIQPAN